jgi:nuclear receptor interaction protein
MPHSDDRKIVSCAGDAEVRIFDIERATPVAGACQVLSTNSTNAKVFRSHSASVKRIVTEASPFYFLTCSEDGTVRQWDIRQPESAYPKSKFTILDPVADRMNDDTPPPLISYRDYNIDLYTLSCSPSQPHYIALGGTHLHCFLHDRRMLGRDKLRERGGAFSPSNCSDSELDAICQATRCVRKFAPHGQPKMGRTSSAQITACKISNANPNELIASWSADHIYSFDIRQDEEEIPKTFSRKSNTLASRKARKRKRPINGSHGGLSEEGEARGLSRSHTMSSEPRQRSSNRPRREMVSLVVHLRSGENVEIPVGDDGSEDGETAEPSSQTNSEEQPHSFRIAQGVTKLKREMFVYHQSEDGPVNYSRDDSLESREEALFRIVAEASGVFELVDDAISQWHYPVTRNSSEVHFQQKLRDDRNMVWRFIQCSGTIARVLLKLSSHSNDPELPKALEYFDVVRPAPRESSRPLSKHEQFCYDIIKAILLWLDSGIGAVLRGFQADPDDMIHHYPRRQPVSKDTDLDALETQLFPYFRDLAMEHSVIDVDPDENGRDYVLFDDEFQMVNALEKAMRIPFADLMDGTEITEAATADDEIPLMEKRETAMLFWGLRVCRALLRSTTMNVDFPMVDLAFDGPITGLNVVRKEQDSVASAEKGQFDAEANEDAEQQETSEKAKNDHDSREIDLEADQSDDDVVDDDSEEEEDEDYEQYGGRWINRPTSKSRVKAGSNVPCTTHNRFYEGHCNIETTKDVNFYGLQDEYVVSGSDCGHLFIWDRKTTELVNILEGDQEVVNVIQGLYHEACFHSLLTAVEGHPSEPMLAVSGIDNTIKIFSPDAIARHNAALGIGVQRADASNFSSIGLNRRRRYHASTATNVEADLNPDGQSTIITSEPAKPCKPINLTAELENEVVTDHGLPSRKRMCDSYKICAQNEQSRHAGGSSHYLSRGLIALMAQQIRQGTIDLNNLEQIEGDCEVM